MKKIILFTVIAFGASVIFTSCNGDSSQDNTPSSTDNEGNVEVSKRKVGNDTTGVAIAYYIQDSIATNFNFYREVDSMLNEKQMKFQKELESRIRSYQAYEADIQKRMNNNEITGYQLEDIQKTAAQKQQSISRFEQQRGAALQKESIDYQTAMMNKISEAGKEFSEKNSIDILFFYQKGGQITYIANAFDVTEEFVVYLNKREDELMADFDEEVNEIENSSDSLGK
jgi:outer membrane protein